MKLGIRDFSNLVYPRLFRTHIYIRYAFITFRKLIMQLTMCIVPRIEKIILTLCFCFSQMSDNNLEMRATAARICRDYLHGGWKHVTSDNIVLKRIRFEIGKVYLIKHFFLFILL